jgi:hypothetical protein
VTPGLYLEAQLDAVTELPPVVERACDIVVRAYPNVTGELAGIGERIVTIKGHDGARGRDLRRVE